MAPERGDQGADARQRDGPKLAIAGRLDTTLDGRRLILEGQDDTLRLVFDTPWAAWRSRKAFTHVPGKANAVAQTVGVRVVVAFGGQGDYEVMPTPHWLVRPFVARGR
ncbi:MAG: hypothetical protein AAFV43_07240 [Planctomycetota bacterium]